MKYLHFILRNILIIYIILDDQKIYLNEISDNTRINDLIRTQLLNSGEKIEDIDNIDYIKYYNENKDLLFDLNKIKNEISDKINNNGMIYILLIIYILFILIIFHILYIIINKQIYIITVLIAIIIFLLLFWFKLK